MTWPGASYWAHKNLKRYFGVRCNFRQGESNGEIHGSDDSFANRLRRATVSLTKRRQAPHHCLKHSGALLVVVLIIKERIGKHLNATRSHQQRSLPFSHELCRSSLIGINLFLNGENTAKCKPNNIRTWSPPSAETKKPSSHWSHKHAVNLLQLTIL